MRACLPQNFARLGKLWRITAASWETYAQRYEATYERATETGHAEAAAAAKTQAEACRARVGNALAKAAQCEKEAA